MPAYAPALVAPMFALVMLVVAVGCRLLFVRMREMRTRRIHPQAVATSTGLATRFEDLRAADNFRNLFEVPVLFYALMATALATGFAPAWLVIGAWLYVGLRAAHSLIHCSYNKVMHRFAVFLASFILLVGLWVAFFIALHTSASS